MNQNLSRKKLEALYVSGRSMAEIAITFNCSIHKVVYWMDKHGIKRRSWSEASYVKLNPGGDPFAIKQPPLLADELLLFGAGLGIYLGEGDKRSHQVRVTNTDPGTLRIFINFLLKICQVRKDKIHYSIICFNDTDPGIAKSYWEKELGIVGYKFGKIVQIPPQGKGTYKRKSEFGVCTVTVGNIKLKSWIMNEIEKTRNQLGSIEAVKLL